MLTDLEFVAEIKRLRSSVPALREFLKAPGHLDRLLDLAIKAGSKKPPKHKSRTSLPGTQLPDGSWTPDSFPDQSQKDRAKGFWAQRKRFDLVGVIEDEVAAFRDYHVGHGTLAADWPATWATWFRRSLKNKSVAADGHTTAHEDLATWRWRLKTFREGDPRSGHPEGVLEGGLGS